MNSSNFLKLFEGMDASVFESAEEVISILRRIQLKKEKHDDDDEKIVKFFSLLNESYSIKSLNKSEDLPYTEEDFEFVAERTLPYLKCIQRVLEELILLNESLKMLGPETVKTILLCTIFAASQFQNAECCWSNPECSSLSLEIINSLVIFSKSTTFAEVLIGRENGNEYFNTIFPNGLLKAFLCQFSQKITKKTWKNYPSYIESYVWVLFNVKSPHLAEYISYFLPPALFILDDWEQTHKVIGVKALHHILQNTPGSELRWYGRAEVIFQALKHHMFSREYELLEHVYPALIVAASVLEKDPKNTTGIMRNSFDAILDHLLREMAHEERLRHRTIYANALKLLIEAMGIFIIRWSEKVLDVCSKYLATYEGELAQDRLNILEALQIYIKNCWPRVHDRAEDILKMVLKLAYEISVDNPYVKNKELLLVKSKGVVNLLLAAAPQTVGGLCEGMEDLNISHKDAVQFVISDIIK